MGFAVEHERTGSIPLVAVSGEMDLATADLVRAALAETPADQPVVIDLTEMTFIDCSGLRVLLDEHRRRSSRVYIVFATDGPLSRILEVTRVPHRLRLYRDRDAAIWIARSGEFK
jgi:anti-sigma B factor antagonist